MNKSYANIKVSKSISSKSDKYHGWPTVCRSANGHITVGFSGGRDQHVCPFGRIELIHSNDNGNTWSEHQIIYNGPLDDRDTGVLQTANGTLLVTWFTSLAWEKLLQIYEEGKKAWLVPLDPKRWHEVYARIDDNTRQCELGQWLLRSEDGGKTWSDKINTIVNSPHGPTQLSDGRLLYVGKCLNSAGKKIGACESTDDGKTWRWIGDIPAMDGDDSKQYHELHAVEATDGRIIAQIRNHNEGEYYHETLQTESDDGGRTWTPAHSIGVWGFPSHLLRLNDGRLLMTYGHRREPQGQQARFSTNNGQTWSNPIIITNSGNGIDHGYPSTAQLDDDSLLTIWYESCSQEQNPEIYLAHWELP